MKNLLPFFFMTFTFSALLQYAPAQNKNYSAYCVGTRMKHDCDFIGDEDGRFSVQISDNTNYTVWYRAGDGTGNLNKCLICDGDANTSNGHSCNWSVLLVNKTDVNVSTLRLSFRATDDDATSVVNDWWMDDDCTYTQNGYDVNLSGLAPGQNHYIEIGQTTDPQWYVNYRINWSWVTVNIPANPVAAQNPACGSTFLQALPSTQADVTWYWQGTNPNGTSTADPSTATYAVSATGVYYLRARGNSNNVWSANSSSVYVIIETLSTEASGVNITNNNTPQGTAKTLSVTGGALGTSAEWRWYTDPACTAFVDTGNFIIVDPAVTTSYYVRAEGNCDTTLTASGTVVVDVSGREELSDMPGVQIYPNPAGHFFSVYIPDFLYSDEISLNVIDIYGRTIITKQLNKTLTEVSTEELSDGFYTLVLRGKNHFSSQKIMIRK